MPAASILEEARDNVLRLVGPPDRQPKELSDEQWVAVDAIAADQRLQPHLHGRRGRGEIECNVPEAIAAAWSEAHRNSGIEGLVQRRDLLAISTALEDAGIACIALKGAWLAWHAYPSPAERVLRDLDLLVAEADAAKALEVLLAFGLQPVDRLPDKPSDFAAANKQFPPLLCPTGTIVELHAHAWEPPGTMEWPTPRVRDRELMTRATKDTSLGLRYLAPADMLAHLIVHAAYSHRFEVGPLMLADIDFLLENAGTIDWDDFWHTAERGQYVRGAALTLAIVDRWRLPGLVKASACPAAVPVDAIEQASKLLLQPPTLRRDLRSLAAFETARQADGIVRAAALGFARLGKTFRHPAHMIHRLAQTATAVTSPDIKAHARSSARVGRWLTGK